jgi:cytosine deaminase
LTYARALNRSGTLLEAIALMRDLHRQWSRAEVHERALRMAQLFLAAGVTTIRTHVDVNEIIGLAGVEALLLVKERLRGLLDLQLVTLNTRLSGSMGRRSIEYFREAMRLGCDAVGGAPALDADPREHIDRVFSLAQEFDAPIDLHMDESDNPADFYLPYLAEKTIAEGYQGRVVAGHCCSLAAVDRDQARRAIERVREAGITVVSLPSANLYLQGRGDTGLIRRGITSVCELLAAGVPVACGSDNVQDPFNPFGRGDLLLVANLFAHAAHLGSPAEQAMALRAITTVPAAAVGYATYGLCVGAPADLVVLDVTEPAGLLALVPPRRAVIKAGTVVATTRTDPWVAPPGPLHPH